MFVMIIQFLLKICCFKTFFYKIIFHTSLYFSPFRKSSYLNRLYSPAMGSQNSSSTFSLFVRLLLAIGLANTPSKSFDWSLFMISLDFILGGVSFNRNRVWMYLYKAISRNQRLIATSHMYPITVVAYPMTTEMRIRIYLTSRRTRSIQLNSTCTFMIFNYYSIT